MSDEDEKALIGVVVLLVLGVFLLLSASVGGVNP